MPHMLSMPTSQIGHPVALFILMITDNGLVHERATMLVVSSSIIRVSLPFLERQLRAFGSREVDPPFVSVLVETTEKHHLPVEVAKL